MSGFTVLMKLPGRPLLPSAVDVAADWTGIHQSLCSLYPVAGRNLPGRWVAPV